MREKKILEDLKRNASVVTQSQLQIVHLLLSSQMLDFLKERALVRQPQARQGTLLHELAAEAQRSFGYNECLQDLLHFTEIYLADAPVEPTMDYGALRASKELGDLEQEEIDAIARNKPVPKLTGRTIVRPER